MVDSIRLHVNGEEHEVRCDAQTPLLYVLRNDLFLNGPKFGCGLGQCGACAVIVAGRSVPSCMMPIGGVGDQEVTTLDGLTRDGRAHPLQTALLAEQAAQCAYCTNGMIMAAKALIDLQPILDEQAVRVALSGHLCRCGVHNRIVRAVLRAAAEMAR